MRLIAATEYVANPNSVIVINSPHTGEEIVKRINL